MPLIPSYFATEQMETSRLPRAPAQQLAETGQGLEAEALAGIGGALGRVGQLLANIEVEKQRARDNVTLAQMKGLLDDFEYISRPDPSQFEKIEDFKKGEEQYGKDWKKRRDEISRGKNRRVADQFKIYTELHWDIARKDYHNKSWSLEQDYALAQFNNLWSEKFRNFINRPEQLKTELSGLLEQFEAYLKPTQKQRLEAGIDTSIESYQIQMLINTDPVSAMEVIDASSFDEKEKNTLRSQARTAITRKRTEANLIQKQKDDKIGATFLKLLDNKLDPSKPQLTFDMINRATGMSFDAKTSWFTRLMTFDNYSEAELKEAFTDNGEVIAEIYDMIDAGTLTDELDTMVGKGLSPNTAERIKREIRAPFEVRTDKLFKNIFGWSPELGFENDLSSFLYIKTERDWREEVKRQDATGEQIIDIGRTIARPYFIEHLKKTMTGQEADIARMVELALGDKLEKTEPEVKPKEDEGPRTYKDFREEVARLKAIDIGKARAFYDAWIDKFTGTMTEEVEK